MFLDAIAALGVRAPRRETLAFVMVPAWSKAAREDLVKALESDHEGWHRLPDPVMTHTLNNPDSDPIINRIHAIGFTNSADSHVNVIYVPCYLNGTDGIFNAEYYDLLIGMDATVFPSYYEPWGYTPLESIAFGVPTVTTSLSGFGQWILSTTDNQLYSCGVNVIGRGDYNYSEVVDNIARTLADLNECDEEETAKISSAAMHTSSRAAWSYFVAYYIDAFEVALANRNTNRK